MIVHNITQIRATALVADDIATYKGVTNKGSPFLEYEMLTAINHDSIEVVKFLYLHLKVSLSCFEDYPLRTALQLPYQKVSAFIKEMLVLEYGVEGLLTHPGKNYRKIGIQMIEKKAS